MTKRLIVERVKRLQLSVLVLVFVFGVIVSPFGVSIASAAMSNVMVRFDNITANTATTGTVCAETNQSNTEASVHVTFPTGYTLGVAGNFTVNTTNLAWPSGASAWPGIGTATDVTSQEVTFPSTTLSAGTTYCFNWTNTAAVTTNATPGTYADGLVALYDSNPTLLESAEFAAATVSDSTINVTATVPPAFAFALSANSDSLGDLSTSSVTTSPTPRTITINTNAYAGWQVWGKDTVGLTSANTSHTISSTPGSNLTLSPGTEGYVLGITSSQVAGAGTVTVNAAFNGVGVNDGGALDASLRSLATSDGTADTAVLTLTNKVTISGITPAATDYTDVITVTGAGLF